MAAMVYTTSPHRRQNVSVYERRAKVAWWLLFLCLMGVSGLVSLLILRRGPSPSTIAWLFYWIGVVAIFYQPRYGVYLILGLTLFADRALHPWYPFAKNFSSFESVMFLHSALIISPLETYIAFTGLAWLGRMAMERRIRIYTGPLFWPALLFLVFVTYGLLYGIARGGNLVIALWEARAIYYLAAMLLLASNLIKTPAHVSKLLWIAAIALFFKGIAGTWYVAAVLGWNTAGVERIAEHSMSIHFNAFFVLLIASWLYHDTTTRRLVLPVMAPFILLSFVANHRRAGFLTLGIAIGLILLLLYREHRKLFFVVAPTGTVAFLAYLAAFWNNQGAIGMMARAVRSVVGQPTPRDAASNIYRDLENINSMFTIKTVPLTGVGFGNKFYIIAPMADISFFEWWEYITHNSILWVWMKTGAGGFFALLLLVGMSLILGGRAVWSMPRGPLRGAALVAALYILMHFIYAYVDMSWDTNSMVFVGVMMALLNTLHLIAAQPVPVPARRWPWQPVPEQAEQPPPVPAPPRERRGGFGRQPGWALSSDLVGPGRERPGSFQTGAGD